MRARVHSPAKFYIKFLLSDEELDIADLRSRLDLEGIDYLNPGIEADDEENANRAIAYLRILEAELGLFPEGYDPIDLRNVVTSAWLKEQRILDMWRLTRPCQDALSMRQNVYLLEALHPLLLSSTPVKDIIKKCKGRAHLRLTPDNVLTYRHYFWNREVMTQNEWAGYLRGRSAELAGLTAPTDLAPRYLPHMVALEGPPSWQGSDAILRVMQGTFSKLLLIEGNDPSVDDARMTKLYMDCIYKGDEMLQRSGNAVQEMIRTFQKFKMKRTTAKVVDIDMLTQGNYSKSGTGTGAGKEDADV